MNDDTTTIQELKEMVAAFKQERNWDKYHTPSSVAKSIAIEAAELLENFQWEDPDLNDPKKLQAVSEELADVFSYCLSLADVAGIDITHAFTDKLAKNRAKYPAEAFSNQNGDLAKGRYHEIRNAHRTAREQ